jgi:Zn-dependent protease
MMSSGSSIQLAKVFGIRIGASPSWFAVLFLMIYLLSGYFSDVLDTSSTAAFGIAVAGAFCFFGSLVFHELGHALAARRRGIAIAGIDLWFFGGLAKLSRDTTTPREELEVAAAGPVITLAVIGACIGAGALLADPSEFFDAALLEGEHTTPALGLLGWLAVVNAFLFVFNMVPAFPLDGGRIARAIAWQVTGDKHRATRASARIGQGFGWSLMAIGVVLALQVDPINGIWLVVLGWFLAQAERGDVVATTFSEPDEPVTPADIMDAEPVAVPDALDALGAQEEFFLRYRWPWFPVVDGGGHYVGLLRSEQVDEAVIGGRPAIAERDLVDAADPGVREDTSLEALLSFEPLRRLGAVAVVDTDRRLLGILTVDRVRRALAASAAPRS